MPTPKFMSSAEIAMTGFRTENRVYDFVVFKLNERHPSSDGVSFCEQLAIDLSHSEKSLREVFPAVYAEIVDLLREEYRALTEVERHCLYYYLLADEDTEDEIVDALAWHFEEWLAEE